MTLGAGGGGGPAAGVAASRPSALRPGRAVRLWEWFFPPEVRLAPEAAALLRRLYPSLRLERVRFHRGMPHAVRALGSVAITLPALWVPRRIRIYFEPRSWAPGSAPSIEGVGTLAHEAYHALQIQETAWGAGPFRPFLWLYFACGAANGFRYHDHPMERDAYRLAGRATSSFEAAMLRGGGGKRAPLDFERAHACAEPLACASAGVDFWRRMAGTTPGVGALVLGAAGPWWPWALLISPLAAVWLGTWVLAASLAWLALALLEAAGAVLAGPFLWLSRAVAIARRGSRELPSAPRSERNRDFGGGPSSSV